jgi:hypothetical protein
VGLKKKKQECDGGMTGQEKGWEEGKVEVMLIILMTISYRPPGSQERFYGFFERVPVFVSFRRILLFTARKGILLVFFKH